MRPVRRTYVSSHRSPTALQSYIRLPSSQDDRVVLTPRMLDLSRVFDIEYSALQMVTEGERRLTEEGVTVWLAGLNPDVLDYIRSSGLADRLGKDRMFANAPAGIRRYLEGHVPAAQEKTHWAEASTPEDD